MSSIPDKTHVHPFASTHDLTTLIDQIGDAQVVMLGEASHGTAEFYRWRNEITRRLITEKGFQFIAVEGDWPECRAVDQYTKSLRHRPLATFAQFKRWPTWLWANIEVLRMAEWLRSYNQNQPYDQQVGFYGLDVYSLFASIDEVLVWAQIAAPPLVHLLYQHYECFDRFERDDIVYAQSTLFQKDCQEAAEAAYQLVQEVQEEDLLLDGEGLFDAQQNARVAYNAERYYRTMVRDNTLSWNIRDSHMMETLDQLRSYHGYGKGIVWAHNTHIGDYRATDMLADGSINIGGLARKQYGDDQVKLVGFGTYQGSVTAARSWDGNIEIMPVLPAQEGSYEHLLHELAQGLGAGQYYIVFDEEDRQGLLNEWRGHRAIGVVYHPEFESGNYVPTQLASRYDAFIFLDETNALEPLPVGTARHKVPQTWPSGV